ncbi:hypothetical protein [Weissella uvarum]|uniref:hypothetical protein n=1 Tax=Weissella uvarum TaxID=1479233 RepID=UPI001961C39A|nr:hypothetical protein [Weissella uvarum]
MNNLEKNTIALNKCSLPVILLLTLCVTGFVVFNPDDFLNNWNTLSVVLIAFVWCGVVFILSFLIVYRFQRTIEYLTKYKLSEQSVLFDNIKTLLPIIISFGSLLVSFCSLLTSVLLKNKRSSSLLDPIEWAIPIQTTFA